MIEHIVLLRFKPGTPAEAIDALSAAFAELPDKIDVIRDYQFGENFADRSGGHTHLLVSRFDNREELQAYAAHPAHVAVVEQRIRPIVENVIVGDLDRDR